MKCLLFVSLLSPIIRLYPNSAVNLGGKSVWLSPVVALPVVLLIYAMTDRFLKRAQEHEGLGDMIIKAVGRIPGKTVLIIYVLWLLFYTGFVIKGGAERLLSSIYPNGQPALFIVTLAAAGLWIAVGKIRSLGRLSEIFAAILGLTLLIVTAAAVFDIEVKNILPVTVYDIDNIGIGAIPVANVLGIGTNLAFLNGCAEKGKIKKTDAVVLLTLTIIAIILATIGTLGTELIKSLQHSYFIMIRDIDLIGIVERIEAAVIVTWVVTDLIYVSVLLRICGEIMSVVFVKEKKKLYILISSVISLVPSFLIINNAFELHFISGIIVPLINILIVYIILPLLFVVGVIRQKI